jgi:hypothetical protein
MQIENSARSEEGFRLSLLRGNAAREKKLSDAIRDGRRGVSATLSTADAELRLRQLMNRTTAADVDGGGMCTDQARQRLSVLKAKTWLNSLVIQVTSR